MRCNALRLLLLILSLTSCTQPVLQVKHQESTDLETLHGQASVSGGAGVYTIPIELPIGEGSFRPGVSVYYNSRSGDSLLGMGWNLSAGGSVHRCPFIFDGDGLAREVRYAPDDRLCLDGVKLVLLQGDYGKNDSVYIPEIDSGVALRLSGDLNSPESEFATFDTAENVNLYRVPVIAQHANSPLSWQLTTSLSKDGREIEYLYDRLSYGEILLKEILYGGKYSKDSKSTEHGKNFVRFTYGPRDDIDSSFLAGGEQRSTRRLTRIVAGTITATGEETALREYAFTYRTSLATGRSLLESAQVCKDIDAQTQCAVPTRFQWQDSDLTFSNPQPVAAVAAGSNLAPGWRLGDPTPSITTFFAGGDYNGDGRRELFARSADGQVSVFVLKPGGAVLSQANVSNSMKVGKFYAPINGRAIRQVGSAEIVGGVNGKLAVLDWVGDTFAAPSLTSIPYTGDVVLLDITGRGQTDVVTGSHTRNKYVVTLYRNEGSSDREIALSSGEMVARFEDKPGLHLEIETGLDATGRIVLATDGEHVTHIIRFSAEAAVNLKVLAFSPRDIGVSAEAVARGFAFADINGDGYKDIVYTSKAGNWQIQMNEGFRYAAPIDTGVRDMRSDVGRAGTLVFDVDSDGRDELVFPTRRVAEFCIARTGKEATCSDALGAKNPHMDLGIYEYDSIAFHLDAAGNYAPRLHSNLHLVGQANRAQPADIFGDGYSYLLSPFDRGVENGWFKAENGSLVECPSNFACGLHVAQLSHIKRDDRSDAPLDFLVGVQTAPEHTNHWTYYSISNPDRHLYSVPPLGSPERFLDTRRYYFTSSMYVVGELASHSGRFDNVMSYEYGAGEYNTAGRGFDGFKWIIVHDSAEQKKYGWWYGQDGPYRGMLERSWSENESDDENDYFHGSPGEHYLTFDRIDLNCAGPKDNAVTVRYHCEPSETPSFSAFRKQ